VVAFKIALVGQQEVYFGEHGEKEFLNNTGINIYQDHNINNMIGLLPPDEIINRFDHVSTNSCGNIISI
jgi:hypothetical protein